MGQTSKMGQAGPTGLGTVVDPGGKIVVAPHLQLEDLQGTARIGWFGLQGWVSKFEDFVFLQLQTLFVFQRFRGVLKTFRSQVKGLFFPFFQGGLIQFKQLQFLVFRGFR